MGVLDHVGEGEEVAILLKGDRVVLIGHQAAFRRDTFNQRRSGQRDEERGARAVGATAVVGTGRTLRAHQEVTTELGGVRRVRGQRIGLTELLDLKIRHGALEHPHHGIGSNSRRNIAICGNRGHSQLLKFSGIRE